MQELAVFLTGVVILVAVSFYRAYFSSGVSKLNGESKQEGIDFLALNRFKDDVEVTDSGLQYTILKVGTGNVHPNARDVVKVHYHGSFVDGQVFDSSIQRGRPATFGLNKVIVAWTEGLQLMVVGEKRRFFVPAKLGYGNRWMGKIPPGSTLIFDVELLAIKP